MRLAFSLWPDLVTSEVVGLFRQVGGLNKLPSWLLRRQFGFQIRWGMPHLI